ncbi:hypothetical protein AB0M35_12750 [Micromonospora sp. NPDC051196]|uniref:hypothetical protein n=1 Tax=Micromonospora sp. NPDC051196 TaxID=3155281 RepID=UPI00341A8D3D
MLPVVSTRPLWWLARWAARLLTGFAVAAAFTLGTWAMPAHALDRAAGPAWQFTVADAAQSPAGAMTPPACDGHPAIQQTVDPLDSGRDDRPGGGPATAPVSPTWPHQVAEPGITGAHGQLPAALTPGPCSARAPPGH